MRAEKIQILKDVSEIVAGSDYLFMCTYKGLKVKEFAELRKSLASHSATCRVFKNRIVQKAAEQAGMKELAAIKLTGDTAFVFGKGDAGSVAKALLAFAKTHQALGAKFGVVGGDLLSAEDVKVLSELPGKDVLRAQLLGLLQAPAANLVSILNMKASEIVNVLNSYKNKLEENK